METLEDVFVHTECDKKYRDWYVWADVEFTGNKKLLCLLVDEAGSVLEEKACEAGQVHFHVPKAKSWTAETPHLYKLIFNWDEEYVPITFGFRKTETNERGEFLVNGQSVEVPMPKDFCYRFNRLYGGFESMKKNGVEYLRAGSRTCFGIWRPFDGTDGMMKGKWTMIEDSSWNKSENYDKVQTRVYHAAWKREETEHHLAPEEMQHFRPFCWEEPQ